MSGRQAGCRGVLVTLFLGLALPALVLAQSASQRDPRLTPQERADPLEPWSLEIAPGTIPPPRPAAPPDTAQGAPELGAQPPAGGRERPAAATDSSSSVEVVRLRAVLVGRADQAARLLELLRAGATLEAAQRAAGGAAVEERSRELAVDELEPTLRAEVAVLEPGGWTETRPWRGRTAFFQLIAREQRARDTLPKLGEGLDEREQARVASLRHPMPVRAPRAGAAEEDRNYQAASIVVQERPEYPSSATQSGSVTVEVQIGLADDVVDARIVQSSDPVFEPAALTAARRSTYRSARRSGVPEQATVQLKFEFVAPAGGTGTAPQ